MPADDQLGAHPFEWTADGRDPGYYYPTAEEEAAAAEFEDDYAEACRAVDAEGRADE